MTSAICAHDDSALANREGPVRRTGEPLIDRDSYADFSALIVAEDDQRSTIADIVNCAPAHMSGTDGEKII
jgi:hypothetical protein